MIDYIIDFGISELFWRQFIVTVINRCVSFKHIKKNNPNILNNINDFW